MGLHGASVGSPGNGRDEHRGGSELDDLSWYQDDSPRASTESETGNKETKSSTFKILEKSVKSPTTQLGQETNKETVSDPEGLKIDATAGEESVLNSDVQMDKPVSVFQQPITDPESSSSLSVQSSTLKATTRPSSADSQVLTTKNIISEKATSATLVETNTDNVLAQNLPNSEFADTSTNKSSNLLQGDELITMNDVTSSSDSPLNSTNTGTGSNGSSINYFDPTTEKASHSSSDPTTTSSQQVNNSDKDESGEIRSEEQEVVKKVNSPLDTIDTDGHSKGDALSLHVIYFDDVTEDDLSDSDPQAQSDDVSNSTSVNNSTTEGEDTSLTTACGVR
ncbi:dentin sialophosphoprotein, partial [Aplysia californica]|uniref:Dentin sialophosphoprotein n=1 Tax=Aplysia californica TaxID=6500 RepID=A0ABM1A850_APLCA